MKKGLDFKKESFTFIVYVCLPVCVYTMCVPGGGQQRKSDTLRLKLEIAVTCHVAAETSKEQQVL